MAHSSFFSKYSSRYQDPKIHHRRWITEFQKEQKNGKQDFLIEIKVKSGSAGLLLLWNWDYSNPDADNWGSWWEEWGKITAGNLRFCRSSLELLSFETKLKWRIKMVFQTLISKNFRDKEIHHNKAGAAVISEFPVNFLLCCTFICLETLCPHYLESLRFSKWWSWTDPHPSYLPMPIQ